jgi:CheY-like chemotaxis protein
MPPNNGTMNTDESARHVLYVDDYEPMCEIASEALERAGFAVTTCSDADAALAAAAKQPRVDIAVVDLDLPGMRGDELARRLASDIPVVLVSGEVDAALRAQAEAAGAGALLYKGRLYDELPHLVRALLLR